MAGSGSVICWAGSGGAAEKHALFADGFTPVQGIAIESDTTIYVSDQGRVPKIEDLDGDGVVDKQTAVLRNLPVGPHRNNERLLADDGILYVTLDSMCAPIATLGERGRPAGLTWFQSEIYLPELSGGFYVTLSTMAAWSS